jgi:phage shock protein A
MRGLYVLPLEWQTKTMQEAMEWATDEVLRLDAEVTELTEKLKKTEAELEKLRTRRIEAPAEVRA